MRNIESSPWLSLPELVEIKSVPLPNAKDKDSRVNEFTLNFQIKRAEPPQETKAPPAKAVSTAPAAKGAKA
jgi:hypothetical protein